MNVYPRRPIEDKTANENGFSQASGSRPEDAAEPDGGACPAARSLRDLLEAPGGPGGHRGWNELVETLTEAATTHTEVRDFLAANPVERRLFYSLFPLRGRIAAVLLVRMGHGGRLMPELLLVQHLLRTESPDDLSYTINCYEIEMRESRSLVSRMFGLCCDKHLLARALR